MSSAACKLLDNGTVSCIRCKDNIHDGLLCSKCSTGLKNNLTGPQESCNTCLCNGSFVTGNFNDCNRMEESCFVCQSNDTGLQCKHCNSSDTTFRRKCAAENDKVETKKKSGRCLLYNHTCNLK